MVNQNENQLQEIRHQLDSVDERLLQLMNERAELALKVGQIKQNMGDKNFYRPERESHILMACMEKNAGPLSDKTISQVFRILMTACLDLQQKISVAYLGPEGSFSQAAVWNHFGEIKNAKPIESIEKIFQAVENDEVALAVVPIENSTSGVVQVTLAALTQSAVQICSEIILPIHQNLFRQLNATGPITKVYAHHQSLLQCSKWLKQNLPEAELIAVSSTMAAAKFVINDPAAAMLGGDLVLQYYAFEKVRARIENHLNNQTRFLVIGKQAVAQSGNDKTTLMIESPHKPGALLNLLRVFAEKNINITWIESRPYSDHNWSYLFVLDIEGHQQEPIVKQALGELTARSIIFNILGSYPKAKKINC